MAKTMGKYLVKLYLVDVVEYKDYNRDTNRLIKAELNEDEAIRTAVYIRDEETDKSHVFDLETGDEMQELIKDRVGRVKSPIYAGMKYITGRHPYPGVSDDMWDECIDRYNEIQELENKIESGKVLAFPRKQII